MTFVRPELRAALLRWRAAIIGAAVAALGLFWVIASGGVIRAIGVVLLLLGAALLWDGIRRARFPKSGGGLGVVEIDERRISYLGPLGGGSISLDEMMRIQIVTTDNGPFANDVLWQFTDRSGQRLTIPSNAEGTDRIFDALAAYKGVNYDAVIQANGSTSNQSFTIWQESPRALH